MFEPGADLKEKIIELLKNEELSINALTRKLKENDYKIHKLALSGYLKALEDVNILKHKNIPPSKIYYVFKQKEKNIYEAIGEKTGNLDINLEEQAKITLYFLQKLFHRPIFLEEIKKCGYTNVNALRVKGDERAEIRKKLKKTGFKIKPNEPMYSIDPENKKDYDLYFNQILLEIFIEKFGIKSLILETKQIKLSGD